MCVILIGNKLRPKKEVIKKCWDKNNDGAGVMWNDGESTHYIKGLMKLESLNILLENNPRITKGQFAIHFRMASSGGKCEELTHPFVINKEYSNGAVYEGNEPLLMHNGHDSKAEDQMVAMMINNQIVIPKDKFSDSRAIATICAYSGFEVCKYMSGKFVILTKDAMYTWGTFEKDEEFEYSNLYWKNSCTGIYYSSGSRWGNKRWNNITQNWEEEVTVTEKKSIQGSLDIDWKKKEEEELKKLEAEMSAQGCD